MTAIEEQARAIFLAALQHAPDQWPTVLDEACAGNADLRARVEHLLNAHREMGSIHQRDPVATTDEPVTERPGTLIGPYKLVEPIGEGGFGLVFVAEQLEPVRRKVALKLIKPGMDTRQVIARFEAERQALAIMDHPNIAKVFDAGATDSGRPYFVMELVRGISITDYCDQNRLTPRERLDLFVTVCHAVQHAHQKGIIHRDIKPSNVLVTSHDGRAVVKVIDFGVAKAVNQELTDRAVHTQFAQLIGTPLYMSPEQAEMTALDIDTRSDIYSLGVLLYELLTGTTPLEKKRIAKAAYDEIRRVIREEEPEKPSSRLSHSGDSLPSVAAQRKMEPAKLSKLVRGDLDWITMKALEKDRTRRYETANGFAMDVQRYLVDEPVLACPPSAAYRLRKFARKYRKSLAAAAAFALLLITATAVSIGLAAWALRAESETREALERVKTEQQQTQVALERETAARKKTRETLARISDRIVEETISRQVQVTEVDKKFLREILKDYEAFAAETGDSAEARELRAEGSIRVGLLRHKLGELPDAEAAFRTAIEILTQVTAEFPGVPRYGHQLANGHNRLGILMTATGRPEDAEGAFRAALKIEMKLVADFPSDPQYLRGLAGCYSSLGHLLRMTGRPKDSESALRNAVEIQTRLVADFPKAPEYRRDLTRYQSQLGMLLNATGEPKDAEAVLLGALEIQTKLTNDFPSVAEYRVDLAKYHNNLGVLLNQTDRRNDAETAYRTALEIQTRLAADFPSVPEYRRDMANGHFNLGGLLLKTRRIKDAEVGYRTALEIQTRLAADFPTVPQHRQELARIQMGLGLLLRNTGRLEAAEPAYRAALDIQKKLVAEFPHEFSMHNDLAGTSVNLAHLKNSQKDFAGAVVLLQEARPHHEAALKANPEKSSYREFWRNNRWSLCDAQLGLEDHSELARAAQQFAAVGFNPVKDAYTSAGFLARCVPLAENDEVLTADKRAEHARQYGDQAMAMLKQAVASGYKDAAQIKRDDHLAPLRTRDDFKRLLIELERE